MKPIDDKYIRTDLFEHRTVGEHFINPCCFGEDFAAWLISRVESLSARGYNIGEPIQEDYGWGFWVSSETDPFWIALSYADEGPTESPAHWVVTVAHDPGLNVLKRLFHKPDMAAFKEVRNTIWKAIDSEPGLDVLTEAQWKELA